MYIHTFLEKQGIEGVGKVQYLKKCRSCADKVYTYDDNMGIFFCTNTCENNYWKRLAIGGK